MRDKGIHGNTGIWLHNFLQERTQEILVNNTLSKPSNVTSGVPQGTVLGPLLFLILIDSLGDTEIDALITAFADDSKVTMPIDNEEEALKLQKSLESIYEWEKANNMKFNVAKFNVIKFGRNSDMKDDYNYYGPDMNDIMLDNDEVRDLGVIISPDGSYKAHISKTISKINQRVGYLLRTFKNRSLDFMRWAWKTYVQPIADYCSQLWGPSSGSDLKRLEHTLKSFTAKIEGIKHLNYWERLKSLKMYSMGRRMERYKVLYIYKIITGRVQNCGISWTHNSNSGTNIMEIGKKQNFQSLRENSFHYTAPRLFNRLPRTLRDDRVSTLDEWKIKLDKILTKVPDEPLVADLTPGLCEYFQSKPTNSLFHWMAHLELNARR